MPTAKTFTAWRKSSHSGSDNDCVEVGRASDAGRSAIIAVRDTKQHAQGPVLEFSATDWQCFLDQIRSGAHRGP